MQTFRAKRAETDERTNDRRPARAEALARANAVRRLHPMTVIVVAVGLLVTVGLVVASWIVHDRNEDRLLDQRVHEAATVAASSVSGLQGALSAANVAAEATPGDDTLFRNLAEPSTAPGGRFVSVSQWPLDEADPQPTVVVGDTPALTGDDATERRAFLAAAAKRSGLSIRDRLGSDERRLGYTYAIPGARSVTYAEAALPRNRKATIASDSAFADLDYALYLGTRPTSSHLLASSSGRAIDDGRTASDTVPFGDSDILLVVRPSSQLGGDLLAVLPWVLGAIGLLLTFVAAFLTERLIRRRERAEELSARLEEVAEENAELYDSQRAIAQQLQRSLMPQSLPHLAGLDTAARYEAGVEGTEVGGDWYDVLPLSSTRLVFSVGDVCGRGLAAAALMASLRYSIRAYALEQANPATILGKLTAMMGTNRDDSFATVVCGTIDLDHRTLTVARAGHPDLLVVERGDARYLDAPLGPPVGVDPDWRYRSLAYPLPDDVTLLAFTDGLIERRGEHLDIGLERLRVAAQGDLPIATLVHHVVDALATPGAADDIAVLGVRTHRVASVLELADHPGAPSEARAFLRELLHSWNLDRIAEVAELLTDELVSNVVRHVGAPMQLRITREPTVVRIAVDDPSTTVPVQQDPDPMEDHGRGIYLVETLATSWGVDLRDDGKTVWFEIDVSAHDEVPVTS